MSTPEPTRSLAAVLAPRPHNTNKGKKFPPEPIRVEDVVALLDVCVARAPGPTAEIAAQRLRALIVILYRTGVRISEALALSESDLDRSEMALTVRHGKGGRRRTVLMDEWGWHELEQWLAVRTKFAPGPIICVVRGRTAGQPMADADVRRQLSAANKRAALRRRSNPHAFRHGFSVEFHREEHDLLALQRQLGHSTLTVTQVYLRTIDDLDALAPIKRRRPPMTVIGPMRGRELR
jgi:site-specific recombinase XerD